MFNSPGLVDFAIRLVNSLELNLPDGHSEVLGVFKLQKDHFNTTHKKMFFRLVKMLIHASYSLPD